MENSVSLPSRNGSGILQFAVFASILLAQNQRELKLHDTIRSRIRCIIQSCDHFFKSNCWYMNNSTESIDKLPLTFISQLMFVGNVFDFFLILLKLMYSSESWIFGTSIAKLSRIVASEGQCVKLFLVANSSHVLNCTFQRLACL